MTHHQSHHGQPDAHFELALAGMCKVQHAPDADMAVADSDVVITATPGRAALFSMNAVRPGTHFTAVGADTRGKCELPEGLLARACVVADDREQALVLGEMQWAADAVCLELGDVLDGGAFARTADQVTVFDMTGLALQDLVLGEYLYRAAMEAGLGSRLTWPW